MNDDVTRKEMEQRLDELAREFGRTHDQAVLKQIELLTLRLAALRTMVH
jgi:predicted DNA-binding protein